MWGTPSSHHTFRTPSNPTLSCTLFHRRPCKSAFDGPRASFSWHLPPPLSSAPFFSSYHLSSLPFPFSFCPSLTLSVLFSPLSNSPSLPSLCLPSRACGGTDREWRSP